MVSKWLTITIPVITWLLLMVSEWLTIRILVWQIEGFLLITLLLSSHPTTVSTAVRIGAGSSIGTITDFSTTGGRDIKG